MDRLQSDLLINFVKALTTHYGSTSIREKDTPVRRVFSNPWAQCPEEGLAHLWIYASEVWAANNGRRAFKLSQRMIERIATLSAPQPERAK